MHEQELVAAASHALIHLADEEELIRNPLLKASEPRPSYEAVRTAALRALETLAPADRGGTLQKQHRGYDILVRCEVRREAKKCVIDSLGLSRRQFYRERHEALLRVAAAIQAELQRTRPSAMPVELGDPTEDYIEGLRTAGQFATVWREASALASLAAGESREVRLWVVASEAARYIGDTAAAEEALDRARRAASRLEHREGSYARALMVAIGEMHLHWAAAECERVRATFESAVRRGPDECALQSDEAILFGIMLNCVASVECDCGRWDRAQLLYARACRLAERGATSTTRASHLRLSAQLARVQGDLRRSIAEHRMALDADRESGQLGAVAVSAVYYAAVMGKRDAAGALPYVEFGLEIARRYYPGDGLARLTLESLPLVLDAHGPAAARQALVEARRPHLGRRDELFLELAETKITAREGGHAVALDRARATAEGFAHCGMSAWACDAELTAIESCAQLGQRRRARRELTDLAMTTLGADSQERVRGLGTLLVGTLPI
jgi:hypothetical protein